MNSGQKLLLLALFALTAWLRISLGAPVPAGKELSAEHIRLPSPPAGWTVLEEKPLVNDPLSPGKSAVYRAPDGTKLTVQIHIAWAERRSLPVSFFPDDCSFLGEGWNFLVRGAEDSIGPGVSAHRIEVQKGKERLVLLSAYSCEGKVAGAWQEFKMALIWQRIRRERKLWVKTLVMVALEGEARASAPQILQAAASGAVSAQH